MEPVLERLLRDVRPVDADHDHALERTTRRAACAEWTTVIDLRSDTVTRPTPGMRAAIAAAVVGDEQMQEDPTVNELQERVAELLGQERALFLPTATMANQIALKLHSRPGDVLIAEEHSHVLVYEFGGAAAHAGLLTVGLPGSDGRLTAGAGARRRARPPRTSSTSARPCSSSRTRTTSPADACGRSPSSTPSSRSPEQAGVGVHMDGARMMNAAVALGVPPAAVGSRVDTVTLCLSKGLGCPLGAVLAGPADLMEVAWRQKFLFGGAMRQAGIVAAAALYALDHHVELLAVDHERARRLGEGWHAAGVPVELDRLETNFVQIDTSRLDLPRAEVLAVLREAGVGAVADLRADAHPRRHAPRSRRRRHRAGARARARRAGGCSCTRLRHSRPSSTGSSRRAQAEQRMPSVSACVFRDGEVIWERVLGVADVASARAATSNDVYRIGSITKTFTAVLIMQLVHAGRIDLEAPLRTYLPEAPVGPTVRMALSHLTGVQREPPGEIWESMQPPSREELIAGLEDAELVLRPGELWHYSNLVFALLGEIVMRVTGESYADVLQQRILDPLGLTRTSLRPDAPKASPYYVDPYADTVRDEPDPEVTESTGAAGWLWSTPADLARWGTFIADGNDAVLPKAALDRMARLADDRRRGAVEPRVGLGLELYRRGDRVLCRPRRRDAGIPRRPRRPARERTGAAVLTNTSAGAGPRRSHSTSRSPRSTRCRGRRQLWQPAAATPPELEGVLGLWWTEGEEIVLAVREGRFKATLLGGRARAQRLLASSRTVPTAGASSRAASAASCSGQCGRGRHGREALLRDVPAHA